MLQRIHIFDFLFPFFLGLLSLFYLLLYLFSIQHSGKTNKNNRQHRLETSKQKGSEREILIISNRSCATETQHRRTR